MAITANRFFSTDPRLITAEVEDRFFTGLKTGNNTFKRTAAKRFGLLDHLCVARFASSGTTLRKVLDVGVSSGTTTLALANSLRAAGMTPTIVGTDRLLEAYLLDLAPGLRVLVEEDGTVLQYEILGLALRSWRRRADSFTGMVLLHRLLASVSRPVIARRMAPGASPRPTAVRLISPRLAARPEIRIEWNDVFEPTDGYVGQFEFIRVANLFNHGYFQEPQLRVGIANVLRYLSGPGAWLLVVRCVGDQIAGTLFRVAHDGRSLETIERIGRGSEIEPLMLEAAMPSEWAR